MTPTCHKDIGCGSNTHSYPMNLLEIIQSITRERKQRMVVSVYCKRLGREKNKDCDSRIWMQNKDNHPKKEEKKLGTYCLQQE